MEQHEILNKRAQQAWTQISDLQLTATPEIYALFFAYHTNEDASLRHAVDRVLAVAGPNMQPALLMIHKEFLEPAPSPQRVVKASETFAQEMQAILTTIESARGGIESYGTNLRSFNDKLIADISVEQIRYLVAQMALETRAVAEQNQHLQRQLQSSSSQINGLRSNLESARREVLKDSLTGINNRKAFNADLERITQDVVRRSEPLVLLMIDIDHFKNFNDKYGHLVGDQVLKLVAHTLEQNTKGRDSAARWGGEEFAILLPQTRLEDGLKVANHLRMLVASKKIVRKPQNEDLGSITLSIGATQYVHGEPLDEAIARADAALYKAKAEGRNCVIAAPPPQGAGIGDLAADRSDTATITTAE